MADTYGPALAWLVEQPLAWVKVNRVEFDGLFAVEERSRPIEDRLRAALHCWAAKAWIVTDGPRPLWYAERDAQPTSLVPPKVKEVSATGSGDVLHAVLLHAVFHHARQLPLALRLALPYAAANAAHPLVAEFPLNNLPDFGSYA